MLAKFHAPGVKKDYLDDVKLRGRILHLSYTMPGVDKLFEAFARISGNPSAATILAPQEWKKPAAFGKGDLKYNS